MTIFTKAEKDIEKQKVILPNATDGTSAPAALVNVAENDNDSMIYYRRRSAPAALFLFFSALAVMSMGTLTGVTIYRLYGPTQNARHFRGMCEIPYDSQSLIHRPGDMSSDEFRNLFPQIDMNYTSPDSNFFREDFELDLTDEESYASISIPDFRDGRRGRFMHDFKENQSVIIDDNAFRCFIMPLDRENVLPPKSFYDLIQKIKNGYYDIDTERVRQKWRVITPAIKDLTSISQKIGNECIGMKVYMLEKYVNSVFKRSTDQLSENGKFVEFSGKGIVEFDLVNIQQIEDLEKGSSN